MIQCFTVEKCFQVYQHKKIPRYPGAMIFSTSQAVRSRSNYYSNLQDYSHIIFDEIHTRSADTDILIAFLKNAMKKKPDLKVIAMSSFENGDSFQKDFQCPRIDIPSNRNSIKRNFLEDVEKLGVDVSQPINQDCSGLVSLDCQKVANLIHWISQKKPPGAILCFLPGWEEISGVHALLEKMKNHSLDIMIMHSKIGLIEQRQIFNVKKGLRKVILATNYVMYGITIPDLAYVVDSALKRFSMWDPTICSTNVFNDFISKTNVDIR